MVVLSHLDDDGDEYVTSYLVVLVFVSSFVSLVLHIDIPCYKAARLFQLCTIKFNNNTLIPSRKC